jgi:hypothetical protein
LKHLRTSSAGLVAIALALTLVHDSPATNAKTSKSEVKIVRALVSGPIEGADGEFSILLEGFAFAAGGDRGVAVAADAFFGSVECTTLETDVRVRFSGLTRATVEGSVKGDCFDFESQAASPYEARFNVVWRGLGQATKERFEDEVCTQKIASRDSTADGFFSWSAPVLGISGSATSIVATEMVELRDRCAAG